MKPIFVVLCLLMILVAPLSLQQEHQAGLQHEFCWKDTYGRGVGKVPQTCPSGQQIIGLLCYPNCPNGMYRWGFDCHSHCPSSGGWKDQGLFCRLAEYGRGAGFPWKFGDGFSGRGMKGRCERSHGRNNCEKNGAMYYPKCKPGYHSFGCCICRPNKPNCAKYNLNNGIDLSCAKKIIIGSPRTGSCDAGKEKNGGLCYPTCRATYKGIGPVCWGQPPKGWVNCGMGASINKKKCGEIIWDQVSSVGEIALNVATLGGSSALTTAANAAENAAQLLKLRKQFEQLKKAYESSKNMRKVVDTAKKEADLIDTAQGAAEITTADPNTVTAEDITRMAAQIAALADPTGIAGTVSAYTYAKCSKLGL